MERFKLRISRVVPSFQLCRSKDDLLLAENPRPVNYLLSPVNPKSIEISFPKFPSPPPSTPECYDFGKRLFPEVAVADCGCGARSSGWRVSSEKKSGRFHVVAGEEDEAEIQERRFKIREALSFSGESNVNLSSNLARNYDKKKGEIKARSSSGRWWFSSDGETETPISTSRSLSDESSIEYQNPNKKKVKIRLRRHVSKRNRRTKATPPEIPSTVEGKVKGSVAVVKDSRNPYVDFRDSMVEMILEKQIFEAKDLEELLLCYLSLNSRQYRGVIVEAFTEIWEVLFCKS